MSSTTLSIKGMHCEGCAENVERALRNVPGVATVSIDIDHNLAVIEGGGVATNLLNAVRDAGYVAEIIPDEPENSSIV